MRKIFFILAFFICFIAKSQYTVPRGQAQWNTAPYYWLKAPGGFVLIDSVAMWNDNSDTAMKPLYTAIKFFNRVPYYWDLLGWRSFAGSGSPQNIQQTLNIGRDLTQVDSIQSNSYFKLTSTTAPIGIQAPDQGLQILNYTGQPRITFKNDSGETPTTENGGMISGSAYGGAIIFGNNFSLDTTHNRYLKLGFIDNDLNFIPHLIFTEQSGNNNADMYAYTKIHNALVIDDSTTLRAIPNGTVGVDSVLVESGGLIRKVAASSFGATYTVDNGLTASTATNFQLGGSLIQNTIVSTAGHDFTMNGTGLIGLESDGSGSAYSILALASGSGSIGAADAAGTSNTTIYFDGTQTSFSRSIPDGGSVVTNIILNRSNSAGAGANNIGQSIDFISQDLTEQGITNRLISKWTDATHLTRTSQFILTGVSSVTNNDLIVANGNGSIQFPQYGAGAATFDASGNITSVSDIRMKDIQGDYKVGLEGILQLQPILFRYNKKSGLETEHIYAGFSAQNVKANIPFGTGENSQGYLSLQDRAITAALVNSVKELQQQINDLKKQLRQAKKEHE